MNAYGIKVIDYRALVEPEEIQNKTKGGLELPDEHVARQQTAMQRATLIELSKQAFRDQDWRDDEWNDLPQPGDTVLIERHAGSLIKSACGKELRIIMATSIMAVIDDEMERVAIAKAKVASIDAELQLQDTRIEKAQRALDDHHALPEPPDGERRDRFMDHGSTLMRRLDEAVNNRETLISQMSAAGKDLDAAYEVISERDGSDG